MHYLTETTRGLTDRPHRFFRIIFLLFAVQISCVGIFAHPEIQVSDDQTTVTVNDAPEEKILAFGKSVQVKKGAAEVLSLGGDVTIDGRVEGDVATIGGNVIQKDGAYIGGDIIVLGGTYKSESLTPMRGADKQTIVLGILEEELRNFGQNPIGIFSPSFSVSFLAQRVFVALLWFIISLVITTIAPGAISRSVARINLSPLKICALGAGSFILIMVLIVAGALVLPSYLGATLGIMGILTLVLGYVFGRVSLQVSFGKMIQKYVLSENNRSETLATLFGVLAWTLLLSLPYVWIIALFTVFTFGIGLIITGRATPKWQNP